MRILRFIFLSSLATGLGSCHPKTVKTVFESTTHDSATGLNETKRYILKRHADNSDFNYSKLNKVDEIGVDSMGVRNVRTAFEPINGKYKYFQFLATFMGESLNDESNVGLKEFHEILIVKTNLNNVVVDAYQFTLEWSEPPLQCDVYKSSVPNLVLTDCKDISQLGFKQTCSHDGSFELLSEVGIIILK